MDLRYYLLSNNLLQLRPLLVTDFFLMMGLFFLLYKRKPEELYQWMVGKLIAKLFFIFGLLIFFALTLIALLALFLFPVPLSDQDLTQLLKNESHLHYCLTQRAEYLQNTLELNKGKITGNEYLLNWEDVYTCRIQVTSAAQIENQNQYTLDTVKHQKSLLDALRK